MKNEKVTITIGKHKIELMRQPFIEDDVIMIIDKPESLWSSGKLILYNLDTMQITFGTIPSISNDFIIDYVRRGILNEGSI